MMQTIALVVIAFISLSIGIAASRSFSTNVLRNNIEVAQSPTSKAILKLIGLPVRLNIATRNGPLYALGLRTITTDQ